jgi:hypothetical protein
MGSTLEEGVELSVGCRDSVDVEDAVVVLPDDDEDGADVPGGTVTVSVSVFVVSVCVSVWVLVDGLPVSAVTGLPVTS